MARIKLHYPETTLFETLLPVRITDLNYGNHLANDAVLGLAHEARVQFLNHLDFTESDTGGSGIIMGDAAIVYRSQAYYGDVLKCEIAIDDISRKSFDMYYRLSKKDSQIIAILKTAIVFFDYKAGKTAVVPQAFMDKLNTTYSDIQFTYR